jgi:hypothetical protein
MSYGVEGLRYSSLVVSLTLSIALLVAKEGDRPLLQAVGRARTTPMTDTCSPLSLETP